MAVVISLIAIVPNVAIYTIVYILHLYTESGILTRPIWYVKQNQAWLFRY